MSTAAVSAIVVATGGSQNRMTSSSPMRIAAVTIRVLSTRRASRLVWRTPETPFPGSVERQRGIQFAGIEVRPQAIGEVQLAV